MEPEDVRFYKYVAGATDLETPRARLEGESCSISSGQRGSQRRKQAHGLANSRKPITVKKKKPTWKTRKLRALMRMPNFSNSSLYSCSWTTLLLILYSEEPPTRQVAKGQVFLPGHLA